MDDQKCACTAKLVILLPLIAIVTVKGEALFIQNSRDATGTHSTHTDKHYHQNF